MESICHRRHHGCPLPGLSSSEYNTAQFLLSISVAFFPRQIFRWLKPVSILIGDLVIRRIDTTTLYHVTEMLWYHVKHQLLLNKMQPFFLRKMLAWQQ